MAAARDDWSPASSRISAFPTTSCSRSPKYRAILSAVPLPTPVTAPDDSQDRMPRVPWGRSWVSMAALKVRRPLYEPHRPRATILSPREHRVADVTLTVASSPPSTVRASPAYPYLPSNTTLELSLAILGDDPCRERVCMYV